MSDCIGTTVSLEIEALAYGGDAVAHHDGRVVFVSGGVPGDRVRAVITVDKGSFLRGTIETVETPSPDRTAPFCPHAERCGGCQWQQVSQTAQLEWKQRIVTESIRRIAGIEGVSADPCLAAPIDRAYRSTARFPVSTKDGRLTMGYFAAHSKDIVDIDQCPVSTPSVDNLFSRIKTLLGTMTPLPAVSEIGIQASGADDSAHIDIVLRNPTEELTSLIEAINADTESIGITTHHRNRKGETRMLAREGAGFRTEEVAGARFRISPESFFQAHVPQAERLVAVLQELIGDAPSGKIVDGYGGVGLFSFGVFTPDTEILLFDSSAEAVADSRANAEMNGYERFTAMESLPLTAFKKCRKADILLLDPPRTGLGTNVADAAARLRTPMILYVSCNPTTLARDLRVICSQGYTIERVVPLDMFPQTYHVETVVKLVRQRN